MNIKTEIEIVVTAFESMLAAAIKIDPDLVNSTFYKECEKIIGYLKLFGL